MQIIICYVVYSGTILQSFQKFLCNPADQPTNKQTDTGVNKTAVQNLKTV